MYRYKFLIAVLLTEVLLLSTGFKPNRFAKEKPDMKGAWKTSFTDENGKKVTGVLIFSGSSFSETYYDLDGKEFYSTLGGTWELAQSKIKESIEFNTKETAQIGTVVSKNIKLGKGNKTLEYQGKTWQNIDDGGPGKLAGAWLITGRERDGEMSEMTPGARRTMKILSGTRFQWIAYNVETKEFFGTGGGTYVTEEGNYIESIEFFSRDGSRVGMNLEFEYKLGDGKWHHKGYSSTGDPIYEVWTRRDLIM